MCVSWIESTLEIACSTFDSDVMLAKTRVQKHRGLLPIVENVNIDSGISHL